MRVSTAHPLAVNRMQAILVAHGDSMTVGELSLSQGLIDWMSKTQTSGQRFSHIPIDEKLQFFFGGRKPAFAADFIEWWLHYASDLLRGMSK
jgi:hypothetical protein